MLNLSSSIFAGLLLGATLLAGCGGHGGGSGGSGGSSTGGSSSGSGGIAFSSATGYNGSSSQITKFTAVQGAQNGSILTADGTVATISGASANTRIVNVTLTGTNAAGTTVTLDDGQTPNTVSYSETTGADSSATKVWTSVSGSVLVKTHTDSQIVLQLTDVKVSHTDGNDSASTGAVTLNGTLTVNLTANR